MNLINGDQSLCFCACFLLHPARSADIRSISRDCSQFYFQMRRPAVASSLQFYDSRFTLFAWKLVKRFRSAGMKLNLLHRDGQTRLAQGQRASTRHALYLVLSLTRARASESALSSLHMRCARREQKRRDGAATLRGTNKTKPKSDPLIWTCPNKWHTNTTEQKKTAPPTDRLHLSVCNSSSLDLDQFSFPPAQPQK